MHPLPLRSSTSNKVILFVWEGRLENELPRAKAGYVCVCCKVWVQEGASVACCVCGVESVLTLLLAVVEYLTKMGGHGVW
jgi:hypothetical protein